MSEKDYYKLLGVDKSASDKEIKTAYRKLAMKFHPDQTKGDKTAEEKFKKVSEAYAVLSDPEKRKQYDTFGSNGFHQRFSQDDIFKGFDFNDILREFGLGGGQGARFSFGSRGIFGNQRTARQKGSDLIYELPITLQEVATGTEKIVSFQHQGGSEKITVKIPKGMISGKKLRLSGKGDPGHFGGPQGDLYIKTKVLKDPVFSSENYDLYVDRTIKLSEAVLGADISVPTLEGGELNLKIPPGIKHGTKLRLPKQGLPHMKGASRGHMYIRIQIAIPKELTEDQRELIEKLAASGM